MISWKLKSKLRDIKDFIVGLMALIILVLIFYFVSKFVVSGWVTSPHKEWIGSYYTNINDNQKLISSNEFDTRSQCEDWGESLSSKQKDGDNANYTCGTGCGFDNDKIISGRRVSTYACNEIYNSSDK